MNKTRILIADDHAIVRLGLNTLLSEEPDFEVVGDAKNGIQAIAKALHLKPDLIVLDLMMPKKDGVAVTSELHCKLPDTKIIILTSFATADGLLAVLENGASGIVLKSSAETELVAAIRTVLAGKQHLTAGLRSQLGESKPTAAFTDRQMTILRSVTKGLSNADIARQEGLAEITVKQHLSRVFKKLGANTRAEATAIALRKHLLKI